MEVGFLVILSLVSAAALGAACAKNASVGTIAILFILLSLYLILTGLTLAFRFGQEANKLLQQVANPVQLTDDMTVEKYDSLVKVQDYEGVKYYEPIHK